MTSLATHDRATGTAASPARRVRRHLRVAAVMATVAGSLTAGVAFAAPASADTGGYQVAATIPVGNAPWGVAVDPGAGRVYVANQNGASLSVIGAASNTVTETIPVEFAPTEVAVDPGTHTVYVPDGRGVNVLDETTNTIIAAIPVDGGASFFPVYTEAIDPSTHTVYVTNDYDRVTAIDGVSNTVTGVTMLDNTPGPQALAVDPGTHTVYTGNGDGTVSVIDRSSLTVTATIQLSPQSFADPLALAIDPSTHTLYVADDYANAFDGAVFVIDGSTKKVTATIPVGAGPEGVAVDPVSHTAYVTNANGNTVSVITPPVSTPITTVSVSLSDSTGAPLDGGVASYYAGGWHTIGTTDADGAVDAQIPPGSYSFAMTYNGTRQQLDAQPVAGSSSSVAFQTSDLAVKLASSTGAALDAGVASYYAGSWHTIGTTSAGLAHVQMLPGNYSFAMTYNGTRQQLDKQAVSGSSSSVTFTTSDVTVHLNSSTGAPLDGGAASYYAGSWHTIATTTNGVVDVQMLPGSYSFAMTYQGTRQQLDAQPVSGTASTVAFTTGQVHSASGTATAYYAGAWRPFTQDAQLLAGTYTFSFTDGTANTPITLTGNTVTTIH